MERTTNRWNHPAGHLLIVWGVAGFVFLTQLGTAYLWDRDEPRNAGCAAEMLARGDWVTPIFNDELRHQKPVLLYWLIMAAYAAMGVNEWAARLPSALLAIGTVTCTYVMGRRWFEGRAALLAAVGRRDAPASAQLAGRVARAHWRAGSLQRAP